MEHARILVAEDEELVALAIKRCLEGFGYEVPCVVASGEEAVKKTEALEADLVLMDIHLQGEMNGIDAANLIKDSTRVPVVYLTAYSDADTLEKARLTEPYGFILKPFEERALEATVKMALSRSHAQKEARGHARHDVRDPALRGGRDHRDRGQRGHRICELPGQGASSASRPPASFQLDFQALEAHAGGKQ